MLTSWKESPAGMIPTTTLADLPVGAAAPGRVALTFDDGPSIPCTARILDLLEASGATATFFVLGAHVAERPELVARMVSLGCTVGVHAWGHDRLTALTPAERCRQITGTRDLIASVTGTVPRYLRPPYGDVTPDVLDDIVTAGLTPVFWSVDSGDWQDTDATVIAAAVLSRIDDGAVVLMHDGAERDQTVEALPAILKGIADRGLRPVAL
jgi:peptidoglycan/xylan/chitin deacetylase (PgdA/CDA1 family)